MIIDNKMYKCFEMFEYGGVCHFADDDRAILNAFGWHQSRDHYKGKTGLFRSLFFIVIGGFQPSN